MSRRSSRRCVQVKTSSVELRSSVLNKTANKSIEKNSEYPILAGSKKTKRVLTLLNERSSSQTPPSPVNLPSDATNITQNKKDQLINDLMTKSEASIFPKVKVLVGLKEKEYSSVYNWFEFDKNLDLDKKKGKLKFVCCYCGAIKYDLIGKPGNLMKHLEIHKECKLWLLSFKNQKTEEINTNQKLDKKTMMLVKFFVSSNLALKALENPYLRELIPIKLSKYGLKEIILPQLLQRITQQIAFKMRTASFVNLLTDIWTNSSMIDYLGLGVSIIDKSYKTDILMIGMIQMPGAHNAENVKLAIESIINRFDFNKSKISSVVCDEGSNLLRLFKQLDESFYLNADEVESSPSNDEHDDDNLAFDSDDDFDEDNNNKNDDDADDVDEEILNYNFQESLNFLNSNRNDCNTYPETSDLDDASEYNLENGGALINNLILEIGSNTVSRYACAAHKVNIAIRKSIKSSTHVCKLLSDLSKFASNVKKSINLSSLHRNVNSKLHRQQYTRWNSSFMMLFSFMKSYKKGVFTDEYKCPYSEKEIEEYIQILLPLYIFTNDIQSNQISISCIIPALLAIIYANLERMILDDEHQNEFRNNLIFFLKKFEYELNSKIHLVAALLDVGRIEEWKNRTFGKPYFKKGLESIKDVLKLFIEKENPPPSDILTETINEPLINNNAVRKDGLGHLSRLCRSQSIQMNVTDFEENNKIDNEILIFTSLSNETKINSTKTFWIENKKQMPNLYLLTLRLLSIPATSSFLERCFSISGIINSKTIRI